MMMETDEQPTTAILEMLEDTESLIARRFKHLRNLVIVQNNELLCALTYNHSRGDSRGRSRGKISSNKAGNQNGLTAGDRSPATLAPVHSVTKSVVALLTGMLIDRGLVESVDQPLVELLGSRAHYLEKKPLASQLTLHQLLSMTTGFLWRDARVGLEPMAGRMMQQKDWIKFTLSLPVTQGKVGSFQYNSAVSHVLSVIIEEATGETAARFADTCLFSALGITEFEWDSDPQGSSIGGWGLWLSPLSMAKIGQLCLDLGVYNGKQIVSRQWIEQMWAPYSEAHSLHGQSQPSDYDVAGYGYQWWIRGDDKVQLCCAEGLGGQKIVCIPQRRTVIAVSSDVEGRRTSLWPLFTDHWIPAVADDN